MPSLHSMMKQRETGQPFALEYRIIRSDGAQRWIWSRGFPVKDTLGRLIQYVGVLQDVTVRKRAEEELQALSLRDELTQLYNRRGFITLGEQELKVGSRLGKSLNLLFMDLDQLKGINDMLGHSAGDQVLITTANILREVFRESDIIARLGGDEFVVLAVETSDDGADKLRQRLRERLEVYNAQGANPYQLSMSIGIARYDPEHPTSLDELLTLADKLMYEEKRGSNGALPQRDLDSSR